MITTSQRRIQARNVLLLLVKATKGSHYSNDISVNVNTNNKTNTSTSTIVTKTIGITELIIKVSKYIQYMTKEEYKLTCNIISVFLFAKSGLTNMCS